LRTIPAREIKRRGIGVVDEPLKEGPDFIVRNDEPKYVILDPARYEELLEGYEEAYVSRVKAALTEAVTGAVRSSSARDIIDEFGLNE
jgi:hypothetical protein